MVTIGFLHTADVHVETFRALIAELDPSVRDVHLVDPVLLGEAHAPETPARIAARLAEIKSAGADVIVCTCSTIGATAERLGALRIDRPMAEAAVVAGERIAVLYAAESTLEPTLALLAESGTGGNEPGVGQHPAPVAAAAGEPDANASATAIGSAIVTCPVASGLTSLPPATRASPPNAAGTVGGGANSDRIAGRGTTAGGDDTDQRARDAAGPDAIAPRVTAVLCPGAWAAWERGDLQAYGEIVAKAARQAAEEADVVVLAQASMAPAAELLGDLGIPVLSSPRNAVEHALRTCQDR